MTFAVICETQSSTKIALGQAIDPAHLLAAVAFFLVVLNDTSRIPVETHASTLEFGMIDEARGFEHSGPALALLKWGSAIKQLVLYVILADVFSAPWGLAGSRDVGPVLLAVPILFAKALGVGTIFAVIDSSFSKLRLFKITEFASAAFLLAVLGVFTLYLGGG